MEESAFWSVPLLFACNDFIFAYGEDFMSCWPMIKLNKTIIGVLVYSDIIKASLYSTTHSADKGRKQIQIHTDSYWIIDFLRL